MNKKLHIFVLASIVALTFVALTGCSMDRWVEVEGGDYVLVDTESVHASPAADLINGMHIDRENNSIKLMLVDGSTITNSFSARPKQEWPSGCPANLGSTRMEVLDLEVNEITIGSLLINDPILVRNCPDDPERVILREDGQIGGAGTACSQDDKCIHFKPGKPSEPMHNPRALSENEKDLAVNIAVSSSELENYLEQNGIFQTEIKWLARLCDESGSCTGWQIDYNWQEDAGFSEVPEAAVWYPAVTVQFSESQKSVFMAVDLNRESVVYIQRTPDLTNQPTPIGGLPDITGWITDIQSSTGDEISGQILVELDESDGTSDKYWVTVLQNTLINDYRQGTRDIAAFSDMKVGQNLQVWFSGPARESYPAQVDAAQIDIVLND
jgi:hypothetical protein